ncbi:MULTISPECIES: YsnF/AvaK domain-containing protein [unclassified Caballeronia]|uniref:YsnF/AvaK domain-containing protein n=1 Tax=unclassified Caballeronia TaxID=2646786 RepID=UPI002860E06D|nr:MULTISPECIES: YsnF/AvaK domain-containing protein [unclassified Caballeronia]MDR5763144.1 YsnF/AvaK domain-containing protein [Caballeronia sp. LZ035]MDR5883986.1 YsnF/AvaK domain-containing protein [Caballeronia sp. LZ032]
MNSEKAAPNPAASGVSQDEVRLSAVQEELEVGVRTTETGAVRVRKVVHEEMEPVTMRLREQHVEVKHVPVNRPVEERAEPRRDGDTLIIPIYEYVPVVTMQLTLKEEVHIKTTETERDVVRQVLTHAEELVVERRDGPDGQWKPDPPSR